jgi:hypothetical protein
MRRIIAGLFMSLDGVVEAPEAWIGPHFNDEIGQEIGSTIAQCDTLLMGRRSYETFAASFSGQSGGMADAMNHTPKFVVSTTLKQADWQNSTLINGDIVDEIGKLKQQPGKNINRTRAVRHAPQLGATDRRRVSSAARGRAPAAPQFAPQSTPDSRRLAAPRERFKPVALQGIH